MLKHLAKDDLCAAASGALLALSFPTPDLWFLAWIALVPWLLTMHQRPFRSGMVAGMVFFAPVLYWLNIVMTRYGGLNLLLALVAYLLLIIYLASYFAVVSWASHRISLRLRVPTLLIFPVLWVAAEYARAHLLTGFPWASLGYSQQAFLPFIQSADIWGVAGVGLLVITVNLLIAQSWKQLTSSASVIRGLLPLLAVGIILLGNGFYGSHRLRQFSAPPTHNPLTVAVAQGNIEQGVKWDPAYLQTTLKQYAGLTAEVAKEPVDLIVWPESATPFFYQDPSPQSGFVRTVAARSGSALLFGSPAYRKTGNAFEYFNSAFLLSPQGNLLGRSDKVHLVPFGEYVPLQWLFPFIDKLVVGIGDFSPGQLQPIALGETRLGVLICYEVIFPDLARSFLNRGANLLVNITNDAWFGQSSAPYQHLAMSSFRAVENRVWIARAANTGISAFIDPTGRIHGQTGLFTESSRIMQLDAHAVAGFYSQFGDILPLCCVAISLVLLAWPARWDKSSKFSA